MSEVGVFQLLRAAEQAKIRKQLQEERVATANLAQAETEAAAATAEAAKAEAAALVAAKAAGNSTTDLKRDRATSTRVRAVPAADVPAADLYPTLPLIGAAADPARNALLHQLLEGGADVHDGIFQGLSRDGRRAKHTPLHEASKQPYNENAVKLLLDFGASVDLQDRSGHTALMFAAKAGAFETLHLLLQAKADVTLKHDSGKTAMDWAKLFDNARCAQLLAMATGGEPLEAELNPELAAMKTAEAETAARARAAREAAAAATTFWAAADAAAVANRAVETKRELKDAAIKALQLKPQHLQTIDAAHCRLALGLMLHARVGPDVPFGFSAVADVIASYIEGFTPSETLRCCLKASFCPLSNAGGTATLSVTPPEGAHTGCTCTLCARDQSPGAYQRSPLPSASSDEHRQSLLNYLSGGPRGAAAAALRTQPHVAEQLRKSIKTASFVEFRDHGKKNIHGWEYCYAMEAKADGLKIDFSWEYELYSDSD